MKKNDLDPLLNSVIDGDDLERLRRTTLECGLARLRLQRRRRRVGQACALAALLLAGTWISVFCRNTPARKAGIMAGLHLKPPAPAPGLKGVKVITDEELFALFPDRPLALVGKPGHQQLVFLDQIEPQETPIRR